MPTQRSLPITKSATASAAALIFEAYGVTIMRPFPFIAKLKFAVIKLVLLVGTFMVPAASAGGGDLMDRLNGLWATGDPHAAVRLAESWQDEPGAWCAHALLAFAHQTGEGGYSQDHAAAIAAHRVAARSGALTARYDLAMALLTLPHATDDHWSQAGAIFAGLAEDGFTAAMLRLDELPADAVPPAASRFGPGYWTGRGAARGHPTALTRVGVGKLSASGDGGAADRAVAKRLLERAATTGSPQAAFELAKFLFQGRLPGGKRDALTWIERMQAMWARDIRLYGTDFFHPADHAEAIAAIRAAFPTDIRRDAEHAAAQWATADLQIAPSQETEPCPAVE